MRRMTPQEAGKSDPTMSDWLALPVGKGKRHSKCPFCGSSHFGTANPLGYLLVRYCNDEFGIGCKGRYRDEVDGHMIHEVTGALLGIPRNFA